MFRLGKTVLAFTPKVINRSVTWKGEYFAGSWSLFDGAAISVDDQDSPAHLHPSKEPWVARCRVNGLGLQCQPTLEIASEQDLYFSDTPFYHLGYGDSYSLRGLPR